VAKVEGYEVTQFARKHGITEEQALKLIDTAGSNRDTLDKAAEKLKAKQYSAARRSGLTG
jgi:ClpP class serine protease